MARSPEEAINSYITDMLALEDHISKALAAQADDFKDEYPQVAGELAMARRMVDRHIDVLKRLSDQRDAAGGAVAEAVKRAGAVAAGLGAAAIDLIRNEKLPKNLRDDYAAFSLASIGYVMLYTTALALGDSSVAAVAKTHLANYARAIMLFHNMIPGAVIRFLAVDGLPARSDVIDEISATLESVWSDQSQSVPDAEEIGTARRDR